MSHSKDLPKQPVTQATLTGKTKEESETIRCAKFYEIREKQKNVHIQRGEPLPVKSPYWKAISKKVSKMKTDKLKYMNKYKKYKTLPAMFNEYKCQSELPIDRFVTDFIDDTRLADKERVLLGELIDPYYSSIFVNIPLKYSVLGSFFVYYLIESVYRKHNGEIEYKTFLQKTFENEWEGCIVEYIDLYKKPIEDNVRSIV